MSEITSTDHKFDKKSLMAHWKGKKLTNKSTIERYIKDAKKAQSFCRDNNVNVSAYLKSAGDHLYVKVSEQGTAFWVFKYTFNKKRGESEIGRVDFITFAEAREKAFEKNKQLAAGLDPKIEKKKSKSGQFFTLNDLADHFFSKKTTKTLYKDIGRYNKHIRNALGEYPLTQISPTDIETQLETIKAKNIPTATNKVLSQLKQIFKLGIKLGVIPYSPAAEFDSHDAGGTERARKRTLNLDEVKLLYRAIDENIYQFQIINRHAISLLLMLGVRKMELLAAKWEEFDFENKVWRLSADRIKTEDDNDKEKKDFHIPLPQTSIDILLKLKAMSYSDYVFPARNRRTKEPHASESTLNAAIKKLFSLNQLSIPHFTVHDLRRTFSSLLASLKTPPHIKERSLNHAIKGSEGVYDQYDYFSERQSALLDLEYVLRDTIALRQ